MNLNEITKLIEIARNNRNSSFTPVFAREFTTYKSTDTDTKQPLIENENMNHEISNSNPRRVTSPFNTINNGLNGIGIGSNNSNTSGDVSSNKAKPISNRNIQLINEIDKLVTSGYRLDEIIKACTVYNNLNTISEDTLE